MTEKLDEWFVIFDGPTDDGSDTDSSPVAWPGSMEEDAKAAFKESIALGFADKNRGFFLTKVTGVKSDQIEALADQTELAKIVEGGFKGFKTEVVDSYATDLSDWSRESLSDDGEVPAGAVQTATGWTYEAENDNPYA